MLLSTNALNVIKQLKATNYKDFKKKSFCVNSLCYVFYIINAIEIKALTKQVNIILLSIILTLIVGFVYGIFIESSCDYHPPIDKEQSLLFQLNFKLISGHPVSKIVYWFNLILIGLCLGFLTNYLLRKFAKSLK